MVIASPELEEFRVRHCMALCTGETLQQIRREMDVFRIG